MTLRTLDENLTFIWHDLMNDRARRLAKQSMIYAVLGSLFFIASPYGISIFIDGLTTAELHPMVLGGIVFLILQFIEIGVGLVRQKHRERFFQEAFWYLPQAISALSFARPTAWLAGASSDIDGGGIASLRDKVWSVIGNFIFAIIPIYSMTLFGIAACYFAHPILGLGATVFALIELKLGALNNRYIQTEMKPVIDQFKRWERRMAEWWHNLDHIKYHGVETKILSMIHDEVQSALTGDDRVWRKYYANWIAIRRTISLAFATVIYVATGYLVLVTKSIDGASAVLVFFSLQRVRSSLMELSDQQREIQFNLASIAKYRRALKKTVPFVYNQGEPFAGSAISITFDGVSHTVGEHDDEQKLILRDVNLNIAVGEKVGIVGPSGAGKSQLMSLLVRAADPTTGRILINGQDLRELKPESLLRYYGVIMQKSEPFEDTVLGNLLFGVSHLDLPVTPSELSGHRLAVLHGEAHLALKKAGLDVSTLPHGLNTNIGYKGTKLSGGQQQRLQIAGAHLKLAMSKTRPKLIIADEPTASLDSLSELTVMEHLRETLPEDTTMFMVAHRLSTVEDMDRIIFVRLLQDCAPGTAQVTIHHSLDTLYETEPLFRKMADAQKWVPKVKRQQTLVA
ncbi:ABC transporter ATP-binding protein [Candidatus Kaiserbacteria bacterium]|nr:ABC transporter ATP-binding protein [Candidatus Kaiserbacteria bacterium]